MKQHLNAHRLISFGCSFSAWYSPTPLDWLSSCFQYYIPKGQPGGCNNLIYDAINNTIDEDEIFPYDLVFIQWSGLLRYTPRKELEDIREFDLGRVYPWEKGVLEHPYSRVIDFYHKSRGIYDTLKNKRINFISTNMLSPWLSDTLGEPNGYLFDIEDKSIIRRYNKHFTQIKRIGVLDKIENIHYSQGNGIEGMMDYYLKEELDFYQPVLQYLPEQDRFIMDSHPNPWMGLQYARNVIAPYLKKHYVINLDKLFDTKMDEYAATWMYFLEYEKEKIKEKVLWVESGNPLVIDKNYIPWFIKNGKITEYKLPIN